MANSTFEPLQVRLVRNGEVHALGRFIVPFDSYYTFGTIRGRGAVTLPRGEERLEADRAKEVTIQSFHQRFEGRDDLSQGASIRQKN